MMHPLTIYAFAALSVMFAISEMAVRMRCKARRRTQELNQVALLLEDHYDALEYVFNDPASPLEVREVLLGLSASISNRGRATSLVSEIFETTQTPSSSSDVLETDFNALKRTRPDLVREIEKAISTGISAMILRWPETSRRAEILMSEMLRKDKDRAIARAVKRAGSDDFSLVPLAA